MPSKFFPFALAILFIIKLKFLRNKNIYEIISPSWKKWWDLTPLTVNDEPPLDPKTKDSNALRVL